MAKSEGQKAKLLYVLKLLLERSDEEHRISMQEIIQALDAEGIKAERKSIYLDIAVLQDFGYDIVYSKEGGNGGYYIASRDFEIAELKLLVDAVQSSKFITAKKSKQLIDKLEKLAGVHQAKLLKRQVYVSDRNKNSNENIYYTVDDIHKAILENKRIKFRYFDWNADKEMQFRKNGDFYEVSPYFLVWKDENYYLVAYDDKDGIIKHYRVDKMTMLSMTKKERVGKEEAENINPALYTQQNFGMFAGKEQMLTLLFDKSKVGIILDRFGMTTDIRKREGDMCSARVKVAVSAQFFGWLTGIGTIKIINPLEVADEYREYLEKILKDYE